MVDCFKLINKFRCYSLQLGVAIKELNQLAYNIDRSKEVRGSGSEVRV